MNKSKPSERANGAQGVGQADSTTERRSNRQRGWAAIQPFSGVLVWAGLIVIFAVWVPDTFLTVQNFKAILNQQAITGLLALGLLVPLAAGAYDLSIVYTMTLSGVVVAYLLQHGWSVTAAVFAAIGAGLLMGVLNGIVVIALRVDSFIGTLATGSVIAAFVGLISNEQDIAAATPHGFYQIANASVGGISLPVFYMVVIAIVLFVFLEFRPYGRFLYATGAGHDAARVAGLPTQRIRFVSLLFSAFMGAVAGIVVTSSIETGSTSVGPPYLLPVFAAVFLGSTQFKPGRFNVWGTLLSVYMLATGIQGLSLAGAPDWVSSLFNGVVLIIAVAAAGYQRTAFRRRRRRRISAPERDADLGSAGAESGER